MSKTKNENIEVIVEDIGDAIIPDYDDFEWDEDLYGEDAPTQIIEGYLDKEIVGGNNSDNLQTAYIEYNSDFEELVKLLTTIIETGEYTEEHKATVNAKNGEYDESYSKVKREISKAQTVSLQNQINDIKSEMLTGTQSEIFNALTKNGAVQGLYLDDNGDIYINAQFLQTRGMSIVNNNNETTLAIDEEGNLTTSGDIVGGTITGANIVGSTFSSTSGNFKVLNDGTVDATSLSVNDEISTETLTVQEINNSKYQAVLDRNVIINIDSGGTNSASFTSGATYKSISAFLDACPRCLNGYTVTLNLLSNINENVEINQLHSGSLTINMNGKVIYGYVFLEGESTRFRIYGNKSGSTGGSTFGSIMPNIGMTQAGGCYSMVIHSTQGFFYDLKVYGGKSTDSNIGIRVANWASAYLSAIQFIGCYNGLRTYNLGRAYISSSSGTTTSYAFSAYHGGQVILNPTTQAGKAGATSHVFISNNSTVTSTGVTWSSSAVSGSNTNSSTTKVEKTVTINSTLGDSYRSTTYNSWKKDSTVRQGNYGYGNCEGCWFYGDQFVPYQNKEITKIEITIKRQAGGVAGAVTHTLKMHNHATRPSGRPTFSTALSKNFSLATNNSTTVVLTTTAEINAFKANKGFGLVPTAQNSTYYSVCSGSATVKITYKE